MVLHGKSFCALLARCFLAICFLCVLSAGCGEKGAILDTDSDGVADSIDQCSATPSGEWIDEYGCSPSQKDMDNDGVADSLDECPYTPPGLTINDKGCPDTDLDGVNDYADQCNDTPSGSSVDTEGCIIIPGDADSDGVMNEADSCPDTPRGEPVDAEGCALSQIDTQGETLALTVNVDYVTPLDFDEPEEDSMAVIACKLSSGSLYIDWGDGVWLHLSKEELDMDPFLTHVYAHEGVYTCTLWGDLDQVTGIMFGAENPSDRLAPTMVCNDLSMLTGLVVLRVNNQDSGLGSLSPISAASIDLSTISSTSLISCICHGNGVSGNLEDIPSSVTELLLNQCAVSGDLEALADNRFVNPGWFSHEDFFGQIYGTPFKSHEGTLVVGVLGPITGDVATIIPNAFNELYLFGSDLSYPGCTVPAGFGAADTSLFNCSLSDAEIDQLIIDFDAGITSGATGTLALKGETNGSPTALSAAALASLQEKGFTVLTNAPAASE